MKNNRVTSPAPVSASVSFFTIPSTHLIRISIFCLYHSLWSRLEIASSKAEGGKEEKGLGVRSYRASGREMAGIPIKYTMHQIAHNSLSTNTNWCLLFLLLFGLLRKITAGKGVHELYSEHLHFFRETSLRKTAARFSPLSVFLGYFWWVWSAYDEPSKFFDRCAVSEGMEGLPGV